jgi:uncharacterized membrane protein
MDAKTISWLSYITIIGWIVALVQHGNTNPKSSLATFHLRQSFGIMVSGFAVYLVLMMLIFAVPFFIFVSWIIWIALIVFWVLGFISALNGEEKPVPVLGAQFQQWFQFIK